VFGNVSRAVRALRQHNAWTQSTLGSRAGVTRHIVSRIERSALSGITVGSLDRIVTSLGGTLHVQVRWHGEQLDRLLDRAHAALQQGAAATLMALGWEVRPEVTFNHFGDRGRVDLLAYHRARRVLLVAEVKSGIGDLQETLGRLDVKVRLGHVIAAEAGWLDVNAVIPALVVGESRAARRTIADHAALFGRFSIRGRQALAWLRKPDEPVPTGLLWFANLPDARSVRTRRRD
jgi:transcriptional regulator with XRE-family HTH domain